jgi:cyclase
MYLGADRFIFQNAQALRNTQTDAEAILWAHLKSKQLGVKFRRQHPLGIYIADFYCHNYKLVIELDGSIHNLPEIIQKDIVRQGHLQADGFKVLRFSNKQIFNQLDKY